MVKVIYKGRASKLRHYGRSEERIEYEFTRGIPTDVVEKTDAAFFKLKARNNPETWEIALPPKPEKKAKPEPKEEPDPEPEPEEAEEPDEEKPRLPEKKAPAKAPKNAEASK